MLIWNLQLLKDIANTINHCGDYGRLFWNEKQQKVFWIAGDSDLNPYEDYTSAEEIEEMFSKVPFVKTVEVEYEAGPYDDEAGWGSGWKEIKY